MFRTRIVVKKTPRKPTWFFTVENQQNVHRYLKFDEDKTDFLGHLWTLDNRYCLDDELRDFVDDMRVFY